MTTKTFAARLRNRGRRTTAQAVLSLRHRLSGRTLWIDHGFMKLPFHGDGDLQELYYHLDGKAWWEKEVKLISPYLKPGWVAVDVGANLGFLAGVFDTLVGPAGQVHCFEPSPVAHRKLQEVVTVNGLASVKPYNMGCGRAERSMTLYCPSSSGNATLHPTGIEARSVRERHNVRIIKLDEFLVPKLDRLDFLKIDTEGHEDEVLAGAIELLEKFKPVVYIELCSEYLESSQRAASLLSDLGYTFDRELDLDTAPNGSNFFAFPSVQNPPRVTRSAMETRIG